MKDKFVRTENRIRQPASASGRRKPWILLLLALGLTLYLPGLALRPEILNRYGLAFGSNAVYSEIQIQPEESIDLLVAGDSLSYTTVDPVRLWQRFGISSYDVGQPGAKLSESHEVLETAFSCQHPRVILLETNSLFRKQSPEEEAQLRFTQLLYRWLPLLRYHDAWKASLKKLNHIAKPVQRGFRVSAKIKPYRGGDYMDGPEEEMEISEVNRDSLRRIEELCRENGAVLILYAAPSPLCYDGAKHRALEALAREEDLRFLDLNLLAEEIGLDWNRDTRDRGDHLNLFGADKVTAWLGNLLQQEYAFPDRREEEELSSGWEQEVLNRRKILLRKKVSEEEEEN